MTTAPTLNLAEAAAFLRLGYESTKALFDSGELPDVSLNQKHAVFLRADLERYLRDLAREQSAARCRAADAPAFKPERKTAPVKRARRVPPPGDRLES